MSRKWWAGITPAGLIVTSTVSLSAIACVAALVGRYAATGAVDPAFATLTVGLVGQAGTILSRTRQDPGTDTDSG